MAERGDDPINVFRDPANNEYLSLPTEDYGDFSDYEEGSFAYYDTGPYGYIPEVEALYKKAKQRALLKH